MYVHLQQQRWPAETSSRTHDDMIALWDRPLARGKKKPKKRKKKENGERPVQQAASA